MADSENKLKLGKGVAFVKSRLKRLPQEDEIWEADFRALTSRSHKSLHTTSAWSSRNRTAFCGASRTSLVRFLVTAVSRRPAQSL